jgi:hypothetical protein
MVFVTSREVRFKKMTASTKERNKKPRELLDLDIREVSLVDRPAIRRKFLVIKRDEDGENMSDEQALASDQETFIFDEVVCKDEEVKKAKNKADEDESEEEEDESEEETKAKGKRKSKAKAKDELEAESEEEEDEEASEKKKKKVKKETTKMDKPQASIPVSFSKRDDGSYDLTGVPEEMQATVEQLCKAQDTAVQKAVELEEILKAERDERLRRDYVEKAEKEYSSLPGTSVEIGLLLKTLNDLDKDVAEKIEGVFTTVNAQLESGAVLEEVGSSSLDVETTAWGRIEKQAIEMMSSGEVSKAAAISKVLEMNPKLYQDYLKEGGN